MKKTLIIASLLAMSACSMYHDTPKKVVTTTTTSEQSSASEKKIPGQPPEVTSTSTGPVTTTETHVVPVQASPYN